MSNLLKVASAACDSHMQKTAGEHWFQEAMGVPDYYHKIPISAQNVGNMGKEEAQRELDYLRSPKGVADWKAMGQRTADITSGLVGTLVGIGTRSPLAGLAVGAGGAALSRGINYLMPDEIHGMDRKMWLEQRMRKLQESEARTQGR